MTPYIVMKFVWYVCSIMMHEFMVNQILYDEWLADSDWWYISDCMWHTQVTYHISPLITVCISDYVTYHKQINQQIRCVNSSLPWISPRNHHLTLDISWHLDLLITPRCNSVLTGVPIPKSVALFMLPNEAVGEHEIESAHHQPKTTVNHGFIWETYTRYYHRTALIVLTNGPYLGITNCLGQ